MLTDLYVGGDTFLHRSSPGPKLALLVVAATAAFVITDWRILIGLLVATCLLWGLARIPLRVGLRHLRSPAVMLGMFFLFRGLLSGWLPATDMVLRLGVIVMLATLVSVTTRASRMIESLERAFQPLKRLGCNPTKISLAISLTLRFIPVIARITGEVREAQRVRGLDRNVFALAVPVIIRTLRMAEEVADAIDARSFGEI